MSSNASILPGACASALLDLNGESIMSNVSTRHNIMQFIAGKSEPLTGQRLAKIGYKKTKDVPNPPMSICASVPRLSDESILERAADFLPSLREVVEKLQDGIIRSLYEAKNCDSTQFSSVSDEEISLSACLAFAESERNGGKITKEYLSQWFNANMGEFLTVAIAEKLGTEDADDARIVQALNGYRDLFASLSGTKTILGMGQIDQLTKVIALCEVGDSDVGQWAQKRLTEMNAKNANLSALF